MADAERLEGTATMTATDPETAAFDYDMAIVGDGSAGCPADVFTGRYGLDTVIFDHGRSSLQRCACLENYLGFPSGVDVETLYGLIHDHAETAGYDSIPALVEAVEPAGGDGVETADATGPGLEVMTQGGKTITARRVVATTRYGGDFLEPLDDDEILVAYEYDGGMRTKLGRDYAGIEGRTAINRLCVTAPMSEINMQAIMLTGRGTYIGWLVITDHRPERGYPEALVYHWDWIRSESELADEEIARDDWCGRFNSRVSSDCDLAEERLRELREADVEHQHEMYISEEAAEAWVGYGRERFIDRLGVTADFASDSE